MLSTHLQQSLNILQKPGTRSIRLTEVNGWDALWPWKDEWNALVERSETSTIFQTFEWHASWWKTFGDNGRLLVLLAEAGNELIGIAPLWLSEGSVFGQKQRVVQFIGAPVESDYCDFIVDRAHPEVLPLILHWLAENDRRWDLLHLSDIPNTSTTLHVLPEFFKHRRYLTDVRMLYEAPTRIFGDQTEDRKVVKKKSLQRHFNYFRRNGQLEFKNCATVEEITGYLESFFHQHIQRWSLTETPSQFLDPQQRIFYKELVQAFGSSGWLLFSVVLFDQTPIAFHFGFEYGNRLIWYKPTFNTDYLKHSPGEVLIKFLLEYALERKVAEFDFTIGEEAFKYRFANHARQNYAVGVFRRPLPYYINRFWLDTKALIKRSPTSARLGRRLLRYWRNSR